MSEFEQWLIDSGIVSEERMNEERQNDELCEALIKELSQGEIK